MRTIELVPFLWNIGSPTPSITATVTQQEGVSIYTLNVDKCIRGSLSDPVIRQTDARILHGVDTRRILLLLSLRRRDRSNKVEFGFGVCELLGVFDPQVPVFVRNDVQGEDRFAVPLNSD